VEYHNEISPIKRMLVPLDGSFLAEQALPFALAIGGPEAELTLFQATQDGENVRGLSGRVLVTADDMTRSQIEAAETSLAQSKQTWLGDRPHVRCATAVGDPAEQIVAAAERELVDVIVMASHGHGAIGRWVIGSVADRVVRTSPIPVMIMRPRNEAFLGRVTREISRIVVPFDGSALAAQALPFAQRLALDLQVPVLLIKVTELARNLQTGMFYGMALSPEIYDEILREAQTDDLTEISRAANQLRRAGVEVQELVVDGVIASAIASQTKPTDVIVMTSHGRSGLRRLILGSVAEKLVRQGPVPVILVPATIREEVPEFAFERVHADAPALAGALI
jgi:nucleotide-binding universal stress UspA family protein